MSRGGPLTPRRVFFAARRVPRTRRDAFVEKVCRENEELRRQVEELLAAADEPSAFAKPPTEARRILERLAVTGVQASRTVPARERGPALAPGTRVADRYVIESLVGEGASGRVYRATDEVLKTTVAVKVLDLENGEELEQLRREAATLRWLRVPGVVNLQDDGVDAGRPYIVTDLVVGAPFPGVRATSTWASIRETAVALLETLARIHAQGVIHGDLKPSNVLVDAQGIPTVLDVGIASGPSIDFGDAEDDDVIAGTPSYMAPERIGGAPASVATDLYAVGVMLHQALAGAVPHHETNRSGLFDRRRLEAATPIRDLAPDTPSDAAKLIDALLERDAKHRPASAYDALDLLEHLRYVRPGHPDHPWLGSRELIDELVRAAEESRSLDIWGPPGAGKTRTIEEAAKELTSLGRKVVWASREGAIGATTVRPTTRLGAPDVDAAVREMLPLLASGTILVLDDADRATPEAVALVEACRPAGTVWVARREETTGALAIPRLRPTDLEGLFGGHQRLFHIPDDAARQVHRQSSGGVAGRALEVIAAWIRAGLATWDAGSVRISRAGLNRASLVEYWGPDRVTGCRGPGADGAGRPTHPLEDVRATLAAGRDATALRRVRRLLGDSPAALGEPGCLELLAFAFRSPDVGGCAETRAGLAVALAGAALWIGTRTAVETTAHALRAFDAASTEGRCATVLRAALAAFAGRPDAALASLSSVVDEWPADVAILADTVRVFASHTMPVEVEERVVREAASRADAGRGANAASRVADWVAWLRYRQHRFDDAAALHRRQAAIWPEGTVGYVASMLAAASAYLEADRFQDVETTLAAARPSVDRLRNPNFAARCEALGRLAAYRAERTSEVDRELVDAVVDLGQPLVEARLLITEAAVAWRRGDFADARRIATRAHDRAAAASFAPARELAAALRDAAAQRASDRGARPPSHVDATSVGGAGSVPPGVRMQAVALRASVAPIGADDLSAALNTAWAYPSSLRSVRREVLSPEECIVRLTSRRIADDGTDGSQPDTEGDRR